MKPNSHSPIGWFRGLLVVFTTAGLSMLGLSGFDRPAPQGSKPLSQDIHPVESLGERPQLAPLSTRSLVAPLGGTIGYEGTPRAPDRLHYAPLSSWQPPPLPFKFLGNMTEGEETVVLLYGGGRTLFVRGVGPLDDDYVVEVVQKSYLVVRHVSLDQSQVIQLASVEPTIETAENTEQD